MIDCLISCVASFRAPQSFDDTMSEAGNKLLSNFAHHSCYCLWKKLK